jgi:uncharacterized membrane protein
MKKLGWFFFVFFAMGVGLYPILYFITDEKVGLLNAKSDELLESQIWWTAFYIHISFGAISLLTGWSQFSRRIRAKRLKLHRLLGKIYVIVVFISGSAGFYLAVNATGGLVAQTGFSFMSLTWLSTTILAYTSIKKLNLNEHRAWMIRSYAVAFAAVTLRIYIPLFEIILGMGFNDSYPIIAWISWVPNLFVAQLFINRKSAIA